MSFVDTMNKIVFKSQLPSIPVQRTRTTSLEKRTEVPTNPKSKTLRTKKLEYIRPTYNEEEFSIILMPKYE